MSNQSHQTNFERIAWSKVDWDRLDGYADRSLFQSRAWLEFLAEMKGAEPVVAVLRDGTEVLGYFSGLIVKKMGLRFLGSPLPGWTTPYMGFNLAPGVSRGVAAEALARFRLSRARLRSSGAA